MPIEIYELVVKATITDQQKPAQGKEDQKDDCDCKEAAVEQVLEVLHRKNER